MANPPTPVVSQALPDGTLLDTLYDAVNATTALAIGHPDGSMRVEEHFDLPEGGRLVPYSPSNNLLTSGCVLLPSELGEPGDKGDLVEDIRTYLARYVDLSPEFRMLAPYYVLLSWAFDRFREVPMLRFQGEWGTGKTRALLALGSICYKPFFASGASTVSPIFHILDAFRGTLILDEADFRFSDMTGELVKILNNGTVDGLPVLRTMTNRHRELNPQAFRVFGPKIVAMRGSFSDPALESRLITEAMSRRELSSHIPIHTPHTLSTDALALRNRLLSWRFQNWNQIEPDSTRSLSQGSARTRQMSHALLTLVDDPTERAHIADWLSSNAEQEGAPNSSPDTLTLTAIREAFDQAKGAYVPIADIAARLNVGRLAKGELPMTHKWVGVAARKFGLSTAKSRGVYGIPITERSRVFALVDRLGIQHPTPDEPPPASDAAVPLVSTEIV